MKVLLVEDELFLANSVAKKLTKNNISTDQEYDGQKALDLILENNYDLIILDIMLPGLDGLSIIKELRDMKNNIPIILTSAKGEVEDKIRGLEMGADDYLSKPYEFDELLARIKTNLRRTNEVFTFDNNTIGNLTIDRNKLSISTHENSLTLTLKEFDLLEYLFTNTPNTISKDQIISKIWNDEVVANHVEVYISYLRKKFKLINANVQIKTIRGAGYTLEVEDV